MNKAEMINDVLDRLASSGPFPAPDGMRKILEYVLPDDPDEQPTPWTWEKFERRLSDRIGGLADYSDIEKIYQEMLADTSKHSRMYGTTAAEAAGELNEKDDEIASLTTQLGGAIHNATAIEKQNAKLRKQLEELRKENERLENEPQRGGFVAACHWRDKAKELEKQLAEQTKRAEQPEPRELTDEEMSKKADELFLIHATERLSNTEWRHREIEFGRWCIAQSRPTMCSPTAEEVANKVFHCIKYINGVNYIDVEQFAQWYNDQVKPIAEAEKPLMAENKRLKSDEEVMVKKHSRMLTELRRKIFDKNKEIERLRDSLRDSCPDKTRPYIRLRSLYESRGKRIRRLEKRLGERNRRIRQLESKEIELPDTLKAEPETCREYREKPAVRYYKWENLAQTSVWRYTNGQPGWYWDSFGSSYGAGDAEDHHNHTPISESEALALIEQFEKARK